MFGDLAELTGLVGLAAHEVLLSDAGGTVAILAGEGGPWALSRRPLHSQNLHQLLQLHHQILPGLLQVWVVYRV